MGTSRSATRVQSFKPPLPRFQDDGSHSQTIEPGKSTSGGSASRLPTRFQSFKPPLPRSQDSRTADILGELQPPVYAEARASSISARLQTASFPVPSAQEPSDIDMTHSVVQ